MLIDCLQYHIDGIRSNVESAESFSSRSKHEAARSNISDLRKNIDFPEQYLTHFDSTLLHMDHYFGLLSSSIPSMNSKQLNDAREKLNISVNQLEKSLSTAKASEIANTLGYGWLGAAGNPVRLEALAANAKN